MQRLLIFVIITLIGLVYCKPGEKYTTKYDSVDLDDIIRNDRLLKNYVDCMMERKKCTKDGMELKRHIPDALQNDCAKCSEFQKNGSRKILTHLIKNRRDWFYELEAKYDPGHIFRKQHDSELKKEGVKL